jgi:hypothetical protein
MKLPSGLTPMNYAGTQYPNWTTNEKALAEFEKACAGAYGFKNTNGQGRDKRDREAPPVTDEMLERRRLRDLKKVGLSESPADYEIRAGYKSTDLS